MKILISGGGGFIGSELKNFLSKENEVFTVGKSDCNTIQVDLIEGGFRTNENFDFIIHTAAIVHNKIHASSFNNELLNKDLTITNNLINSINPSSIKYGIIYISSVSVYGIESGVNISEDEKVNPKSSYAKAKYLNELSIKKWSINNNKFYYLLRLPLVYGKNPKGNLKDVAIAIKKNLFFKIKHNDSLKSTLFINDLNEHIVKIIKSKNSGVYNLVSKNLKFNSIINMIERDINKKSFFLPKKFIFIVFSLLGFIPVLKRKFNIHVYNKMTSSLTFDNSKSINKLKWD